MVYKNRDILAEKVVDVWRKRACHIVNRTIGQVTILVVLVIFYGFSKTLHNLLISASGHVVDEGGFYHFECLLGIELRCIGT